MLGPCDQWITTYNNLSLYRSILARQLTASSLLLFMHYCHFIYFLLLHLLTSDSDFSRTEL